MGQWSELSQVEKTATAQNLFGRKGGKMVPILDALDKLSYEELSTELEEILWTIWGD